MPKLRNSPGNRLLPLLLVAALASALAPATAHAQRGAIVSKTIGVSRREASLRLGFSDNGALDLELRNGSVRLNGQTVGSYRAGDALETAWRALLGEAASLDGGALADHLRAWTPPPSVPEGEREVARRMDEALETALSGSAPTAAPNVAVTPTRVGAPPEGVVSALMGRPRRLVELGQLLEGLELSDVQVHVGEDVVVPAGETVPGSVVVVDGDLDVRGEIDGDVVMVGGSLRLPEGGRVRGDVRISDGRVLRDGGEVLGDVTTVRGEADERSDRERIREQVRDELRREARRENDGGGAGFMAPLRNVGRAIGELIGSVLAALLIALLGGGLAVHYAREQLEVVAETARRAPLRAGMVGLAGAFLTVPAWILGGLALIVTIVGILALPFWIVLFPMAVCLAAAVGYLGVAQGIGEWVAQQRYARLDWVRVSNPYTTVIAGVGVLTLAFIASNAIQVLGFLRFVSVLLGICGVLMSVAAVLVGFGALLLTRGGRRLDYADGVSYWGDPWDDDDLGFGGTRSRPEHGPRPGPSSGPAAGAATEARDDRPIDEESV